MNPSQILGQARETLAVRPVRSYRADNNGQTRVRTLIQVPLGFLEPAGNALTYEVAVKVADQAGVALHTDSWRSHAPAAAKIPGAYGLNMLDFAVAPGAYTVTVQVKDSVSGKELQASTPVEGYTTRPDASDLMLASAMRVADAQDTVPRPGEMRRGNTLFSAAAQLRLTTLRTEVFYILEAYNDGTEENGTMSVAVVDETGKALFQTPPAAVGVAAGGGILKGRVDLDGLPPGSYTLKVLLTINGRSVERSAGLVMAPLEETLRRDVARIDQEKVADEGYFKYLDVAALDSVQAPLRYIADPGELKIWNKNLSEEAKRRFLTEFWAKRDPDGAGGRNEAREKFYAAIDFANRTYWEKKTPGWKTDRGRIFARWGAPDELLHREQEGRAPPYEAWRYSRHGRWYIFADLTGIDNWKLMTSSDLRESRQPDWRDRLTDDGVRDCGRFLAVDFYSASQEF
jgi:GWxTD domain-containing protein